MNILTQKMANLFRKTFTLSEDKPAIRIVGMTKTIVTNPTTNPALVNVTNTNAEPIPTKVLNLTSEPIPTKVLNLTNEAIPTKVTNTTSSPVPSKVTNTESTPVPTKVVNTTGTPVLTKVINTISASIPTKVTNTSTDPALVKAVNKITEPVFVQSVNNTGKTISQFTKVAVPDLSTDDYEPTSGDFSNGFGIYTGLGGTLKFKALNNNDWVEMEVLDYAFLNMVFKAISKDSTAQVQIVGI